MLPVRTDRRLWVRPMMRPPVAAGATTGPVCGGSQAQVRIKPWKIVRETDDPTAAVDQVVTLLADWR
jgi:hypothetical protein